MSYDRTEEEFVIYIRQAMEDRSSDSYVELYGFLINCFTRADTQMEGRIYREKFDDLIEEAALLPRKFGFAPSAEVLYPTEHLKEAGRSRWFDQMDRDKVGYITLEEWISFATDHIARKMSHIPKDHLGGSENVSKEDFIAFIKRAVIKDTPEYRQLYFFLLKAFRAGDVDKDGKVGLDDFDRMIEMAAEAPRRFGLAPRSSDLYRSEKARLERRQEEFDSMDIDNNGKITFDEWLTYAYRHIAEKTATLD